MCFSHLTRKSSDAFTRVFGVRGTRKLGLSPSLGVTYQRDGWCWIRRKALTCLQSHVDSWLYYAWAPHIQGPSNPKLEWFNWSRTVQKTLVWSSVFANQANTGVPLDSHGLPEDLLLKCILRTRWKRKTMTSTAPRAPAASASRPSSWISHLLPHRSNSPMILGPMSHVHIHSGVWDILFRCRTLLQATLVKKAWAMYSWSTLFQVVVTRRPFIQAKQTSENGKPSIQWCPPLERTKGSVGYHARIGCRPLHQSTNSKKSQTTYDAILCFPRRTWKDKPTWSQNLSPAGKGSAENMLFWSFLGW